jgi:N-acetylmuramoyl-L-alanine amidase
VANVILNRVECDEFPDTVREVVYQKSQFSPVMNGTIDTCKITEETESAVSRALNGEDISDGALYFMNRKKSASRNVRWFDTRLQFLFKHGEHEFFK